MKRIHRTLALLLAVLLLGPLGIPAAAIGSGLSDILGG